MVSSKNPLPRLFVVDKLDSGASVKLNPAQIHYLTKVMRLRATDTIALFNGRDGEWLAQLAGGKTLHVTEQTHKQPKKGEGLWLCPAILKKGPFDFLIMKATELGANVIQPLLTARTQVRQINRQRLTAIAIEAAEQCKRLTVPDIRAPILLEDLLKNWPNNTLPLICAEFGDAAPVAQALHNIHGYNAAILTGPEGGWSQEEMQSLRALPNAIPLRLGDDILRAETAALACLTLWQALCGMWKDIDNKQ